MTLTDVKLDLSPHDHEELKRILREHLSGYEVWALGSRVKGTAKPYSDLDLVIVTREPLSIAAMADIREAFDEADMTIKVDVLDWEKTSQAFKKIIEENRVVVQFCDVAAIR